LEIVLATVNSLFTNPTSSLQTQTSPHISSPLGNFLELINHQYNYYLKKVKCITHLYG
jgi:hypothetical protein